MIFSIFTSHSAHSVHINTIASYCYIVVLQILLVILVLFALYCFGECISTAGGIIVIPQLKHNNNNVVILMICMMVSFVYQYCKLKILLMALNKLKTSAIMVYPFDSLIINKIFGIYTLYCCTNKILSWYQCSCKKINGLDNICNKTVIMGCARIVIFIFYFFFYETRRNVNDNNTNTDVYILIAKAIILIRKMDNYFFSIQMKWIDVNNTRNNRMIFII